MLPGLVPCRQCEHLYYALRIQVLLEKHTVWNNCNSSWLEAFINNNYICLVSLSTNTVTIGATRFNTIKMPHCIRHNKYSADLGEKPLHARGGPHAPSILFHFNFTDAHSCGALGISDWHFHHLCII